MLKSVDTHGPDVRYGYVRRIFTERGRLVVYLEQAEIAQMTAEARKAGMTLVEWAREALRHELSIPLVDRAPQLPEEREVPTPERSTAAPKRVSRARRTCAHGTAKGDHCWQCQGLAKAQDGQA